MRSVPSRRAAISALAMVAIAPGAVALSNAAEAARIGLWLQTRLDEAGLAALRRLARESGTLSASARAARIRADFEGDGALQVEGWLLSRTECAAYLAAYDRFGIA